MNKALYLCLFLFHILNIFCAPDAPKGTPPPKAKKETIPNKPTKTQAKPTKKEVKPPFKDERKHIKEDIVDSFSREWANKMMNYESDYVYMIPVRYKETRQFFENITVIPTTLVGAYILDQGQKTGIDFKIFSPSNTIIYANRSTNAIFELEVNETGLYRIEFINRQSTTELKPTFTMTTGQNSVVHRKDLTQSEKNMDDLSNFLKSFQTQNQMKRTIFRRRRQIFKKNNKYFYTFSIIESVLLIVVSVWQYYYMKHLFEIKGSL
ncbi:MAG: emp24/gp25L/p24 family protein [archaeon]|nr:emp24/gp25L/p24 family protein [archaeon]